MSKEPTQAQIPKVKDDIAHLKDLPNTIHPGDDELRRLAEPYGQRTEFGNYNFITSVRNRSASLTVYVGSERVQQPNLTAKQRHILNRLDDTLRRIHEHLRRCPLVRIERTMGNTDAFRPHCALSVSVAARHAAYLPYMWGQTLLPYRPGGEALEFHLVYVPEWPENERQILVFPEQGVTFVLGSDYMGEAKKGFLRMAMWEAKQRDMLGVHAGSKIVVARHPDGRLLRYSMLLFGLSATGKTTHACHDHGLCAPGETIEVVQDDVVFLRKDGSALGTERGFYLKTDGLEPIQQPLLYQAATAPDTVLENVTVDYEGRVNFSDETLTSNGRGVVQMARLAPSAAEDINIPPLDELDGMIIIFITRRNTVLPMASKLGPEEAAAAFMLGESVESSAGDPRRAGESVRVVGTNPFIVGDEADEGNWFYDFVMRHPEKVECYLINTGGVGELREKTEEGTVVRRPVSRIAIAETSAIFRAICRHSPEWVPEPHFGALVPNEVEGVDMSRFDPRKYYNQADIAEYVRRLKEERVQHLQAFERLDRKVLAARL